MKNSVDFQIVDLDSLLTMTHVWTFLIEATKALKFSEWLLMTFMIWKKYTIQKNVYVIAFNFLSNTTLLLHVVS